MRCDVSFGCTSSGEIPSTLHAAEAVPETGRAGVDMNWNDGWHMGGMGLWWLLIIAAVGAAL